MHFLAPALTLTLTLNHLANKQLRASNALYSLINGGIYHLSYICMNLRTDIKTLTCLLRHVTSVLYVQILILYRRNMAGSVGNFRKELLHPGKGEVPSFQKNTKVDL